MKWTAFVFYRKIVVKLLFTKRYSLTEDRNRFVTKLSCFISNIYLALFTKNVITVTFKLLI